MTEDLGDKAGSSSLRSPEPAVQSPPSRVTIPIAQCCKRIYGSGYGFRGAHCSRPGTVEREGKPFCRQHDPEAQKARRDKKYAEYLAKSEAKNRAAARQTAIAIAERAVIAAARETYRLVRIEGYHCNAPVLELFDAIEALAAAQGIVTGTDETHSGSVERSEIEPGPATQDAPK